MIADIVQHIVTQSTVDVWYVLRLTCRKWCEIVDKTTLATTGDFFYDTFFAGKFNLLFVLKMKSGKYPDEALLRNACIQGKSGLLDCVFSSRKFNKTYSAFALLIKSNQKSPQLARCVLTFIKHGHSVTKKSISLLFAALCNSRELLQYIFDRRDRKHNHKCKCDVRCRDGRGYKCTRGYSGDELFSVIFSACNCDHIDMLLDQLRPGQFITQHMYTNITRRRPGLGVVLHKYLRPELQMYHPV